jgi:hypothetical protein
MENIGVWQSIAYLPGFDRMDMQAAASLGESNVIGIQEAQLLFFRSAPGFGL